MTRLFTDGAEMQDFKFWDFASATGVIGTATPFESPCYYIMKAVGYCDKSFTALSESYLRFRLRFEVATSLIVSNRFPRLRTTATEVAWLALDAANKLICSATTIGVLQTSELVMTYGQWYLVEWYYKEANSPNGATIVYVDGNKVIDYTGDTQPAAATTFDSIEFYVASNGDIWIDDLAMNDTVNTDGKNDNSWCGDGIVVPITPTGDGTTNDWMGSDGNQVSNYLLVDEYPNDGDTTYVYHDGAVTGHQEQYAMSNADWSTKTIKRIYAEARARKTSGQSVLLKLGYLPSGGTDQLCANRNLVIGTYGRVVGDEAKVNPVDSGAWEDADLDALEFVMEAGATPA